MEFQLPLRTERITSICACISHFHDAGHPLLVESEVDKAFLICEGFPLEEINGCFPLVLQEQQQKKTSTSGAGDYFGHKRSKRETAECICPPALYVQKNIIFSICKMGNLSVAWIFLLPVVSK
ncbi:hypothetical protein NPIL_629091 [Nephila pilipes]|uniref:Uncharacterized protein n=1 Tax=Nephila pilipes TaxID=299642 RepID=A0A8X6UFB9_NEPPI|nr:hypothetical protein NPIL_629091 [Nephila pilipes]